VTSAVALLGASVVVPGMVGTASAEPAVQGNLFLNASMRIKDDEVVKRRDKYCNRAVSAMAPLNLTAGQLYVHGDGKCGGEVRVEVHAYATHVGQGRLCDIKGDVLLYEGTSSSSNDLDGEKHFSFGGCLAPNEITPSQHIEVDNRGDKRGGDWAKVDISLRNGLLAG
jgi:hypothetical protein